MSDQPTVVFFPEGAYGPTNNCIGMGQVLQERGVRVVFILEESFAGTLEARGIEERLMRLGPAPEVEEAPGQFWKDFIAATAPEFRKPTIEQLTTFIEPTMRALVEGAMYVDDRLREIMVNSFRDVLKLSLQHKVNMRTAAYMVAISRVATVHRLRGIYA